MPPQAKWLPLLPDAIQSLSESPYPYVTRDMLQSVLQVGRRRAQQIMAPCVREQVGSSGVADREELIRHLRNLGTRPAATVECQRRKRVGAFLQNERERRYSSPTVLVEAPVAILNQALSKLPPGIELGPGLILVRFETAQEALQKLLNLAMAIGNDSSAFEEAVSSEYPVLD